MGPVEPDRLREIVRFHEITASEVSNQPVNLQPNYMIYPVRIRYYDAGGTWTFIAQISYDNNQSWVSDILGATTARYGQLDLNVNLNQSTDAGLIILKVFAMLAGESDKPYLAYHADLVLPEGN